MMTRFSVGSVAGAGAEIGLKFAGPRGSGELREICGSVVCAGAWVGAVVAAAGGNEDDDDGSASVAAEG